jgi:hypothetical protein
MRKSKKSRKIPEFYSPAELILEGCEPQRLPNVLITSTFSIYSNLSRKYFFVTEVLDSSENEKNSSFEHGGCLVKITKSKFFIDVEFVV